MRHRCLVGANGNAGGVSGYSNAATVALLPAPTALTATALSSSQVQVAWAYSAAGATGFVIQCREGDGAFTQVATAAGSARKAYVSVTAPGVRTYRVRATNVYGVSSPSNTATVVVLPPVTALRATAESSLLVRLKWTFATDLPYSGFVVERMLPGATDYTRIAVTRGDVREYIPSAAVAGLCKYRVRARWINDTSSGATASVPVLTAPSRLTITRLQNRQVRLEWVDNSCGESGFKIERLDNGAPIPAVIVPVAADVESMTLTLPRAGTYAFRVRAYYATTSVSCYSGMRRVAVP